MKWLLVLLLASSLEAADRHALAAAAYAADPLTRWVGGRFVQVAEGEVYSPGPLVRRPGGQTVELHPGRWESVPVSLATTDGKRWSLWLYVLPAAGMGEGLLVGRRLK